MPAVGDDQRPGNGVKTDERGKKTERGWGHPSAYLYKEFPHGKVSGIDRDAHQTPATRFPRQTMRIRRIPYFRLPKKNRNGAMPFPG
jgi:hypothetical protein